MSRSRKRLRARKKRIAKRRKSCCGKKRKHGSRDIP